MLQISCQDKNLKQLVTKQFLESAESFIPLLNAWHSKRNIYLFSQEHKIGGHAKFTWKCWYNSHRQKNSVRQSEQ